MQLNSLGLLVLYRIGGDFAAGLVLVDSYGISLRFSLSNYCGLFFFPKFSLSNIKEKISDILQRTKVKNVTSFKSNLEKLPGKSSQEENSYNCL